MEVRDGRLTRGSSRPANRPLIANFLSISRHSRPVSCDAQTNRSLRPLHHFLLLSPGSSESPKTPKQKRSVCRDTMNLFPEFTEEKHLWIRI